MCNVPFVAHMIVSVRMCVSTLTGARVSEHLLIHMQTHCAIDRPSEG